MDNRLTSEPVSSSRKPFFEIGRLPFVSDRRCGNVALITIERPEQGNALNPATLFNLRRTLETVLDDASVKGVVLTAARPGFVLGASIDYLIRGIRERLFPQLHMYTKLGNDCFDLIAGASKPVIALVNGPALGGGVELALACHTRYATTSASFSLPETGLGICPLWGAIPRLSRLLGTGLAKWLVYSGKMVKSLEAVQLGLVHEVLPSDDAMTKVIETAENGLSSSRPFFPTMPDKSEISSFFSTKTLSDILFTEPVSHDKQLLNSLRSLKKNSFLALQFAEKLFELEEQVAPDRASYYRYVVEHLYCSEDTILGLEWKKEGKIARPPFPSNGIFDK